MKIQVNTDKNVEGSEALSDQTQADLETSLARFQQRLTRVEVHLRNESAGRSTGDDFRCLIEARPAGMDPVTVSHHAAMLPDALHGATDKLETLLTSKFERLEGQETRETIRGPMGRSTSGGAAPRVLRSPNHQGDPGVQRS